MLMEKLEALIGAVPAGSEDVAWILSALILLYILDEFVSLVKIAFRGLH